MIDKLLKKVMHRLTQEESNPTADNLQIATAVLFLELAYADFELAPAEEEKIRKSLRAFFDMEDGDLDDLLLLAREKREQRDDIWLFTDTIKKNWPHATRVRVLEMLWQLVFADGHMDIQEEALMRKLTNLLGLSHGDMIMARRAANTTDI